MIFPLAVNPGSTNGQNTENRSAGVQEDGAASTPIEQYEVIYSHLVNC
jgi:hypothetical protein